MSSPAHIDKSVDTNLSKKAASPKISTAGLLKLKSVEKKSHPIIRSTFILSDETSEKLSHILPPKRSGSFDDYIHERFLPEVVPRVEAQTELYVDGELTNEYFEDDNYYSDNQYEDYNSLEEDDYNEYIEKADARPTTVRTGGGGKKIPFHSGKGTRAKEANIAKGTVLLPNGNILIK
jgi:hypothetical protein